VYRETETVYCFQNKERLYNLCILDHEAHQWHSYSLICKEAAQRVVGAEYLQIIQVRFFSEVLNSLGFHYEHAGIDIDIFVNCSWVTPGGSTHLHIKNT
jgi:hypothetical protein